MAERTTQLAKVESETVEVRKRLSDPAHLQKIRDIYFKGADDIEFQLCIQTCRHLGLDPFARQIYFIPVWDKDLGRYKLIPCVSIDGLRTTAERTGEYRGPTPPQWCGPDGVWVDVWLADNPPSAARIGVLREGFPQPTYGVVRYRSFVKTGRDGRPLGQWGTMPDHMLAKCAEAQALRKAFPRDLGGDFAVEEAEPNEEAQALQTPEAIADIIDEMRKAATLDDLSKATARLKGAPMDDEAKEAARTAWHKATERLKKEAKPESKPESEPEPKAEPKAENHDRYDYGPPAMTDAELEAVETGKQSGFGFGDKGEK